MERVLKVILLSIALRTVIVLLGFAIFNRFIRADLAKLFWYMYSGEKYQIPILLGISALISPILVIGYYWRRDDLNLYQLWGDIHLRHSYYKNIIWIIVLAVSPFMLILGYLYFFDIIEVSVNQPTVSVVLSFLILWICVALGEELLFRGYLVNYLSKAYNTRIAIFVSSVVFSAVHVLNGGMNLLAIANIFLAGWLLSLIYLTTKTLLYPVIFHFFWNISQQFLGFNVSSFELISIINWDYENVFLGEGGVGFEGGLFCTTYFFTLIGFYEVKYWKRGGFLNLGSEIRAHM